jgi:hypothetical protein
MKRLIVGTVLVATALMSVAPKAAAVNWVNVVTGEDTGKTYQIDLDSRRTYVSKTGWRHVAFWIASSEERHSHRAVASCSPFQISVPDYGWQWEADMSSYSVRTVAGKIARAACNW